MEKNVEVEKVRLAITRLLSLYIVKMLLHFLCFIKRGEILGGADKVQDLYVEPFIVRW
jgi:hypothetical protein